MSQPNAIKRKREPKHPKPVEFCQCGHPATLHGEARDEQTYRVFPGRCHFRGKGEDPCGCGRFDRE